MLIQKSLKMFIHLHYARVCWELISNLYIYRMSKKAIAHLSKDTAMKSIIQQIELLALQADRSVYESLLRSITSQQLSVKAAATIHGRFLDLFKNQYPDPKKLLKLDLEILRSAGLSRQKASYVQNVADFFIKEKLLDQKDWSDQSDEAIIQQLTQIKGVGKWTVQMILMFTLDRPDIFPIDDLGIQNAMLKLYELEGKYTKDRAGRKAMKQQLITLSEVWSPYRTLACRYLWKYN